MTIPHVLHRIWVGPPMPAAYEAFWQQWQQLHPAWTLRTWGEEEIASLHLRNQDLFDRAERLVPHGLAGQLRSDVVRLEVLHQYGGVYVDTDMEPLRCIEPLLEGTECFVGWVVPRKWVNNAVIGAAPAHPFMAALISGMSASLLANPKAAPRVVSGPQYMTRVLQDWHGAEVTVYPKSHFYPYLWSELHMATGQYGDAYAVHHWGNRRRERGRSL